MSKNWIAVASAEHVRLGRSQGFMQVSHGKAAPLRRIRSGDRVVFYSPTEAFRGKDRLRAFTAIGIVKEEHSLRAQPLRPALPSELRNTTNSELRWSTSAKFSE